MEGQTAEIGITQGNVNNAGSEIDGLRSVID